MALVIAFIDKPQPVPNECWCCRRSEGWKQNINLGKVNNQNFVNIPFNRLIHMIRYKAEEYGIQVIVREERYTSRQSALDFDQLPNYGDKNANLVPSSGKRIGGLFIRSNGQKINADVNGWLCLII